MMHINTAAPPHIDTKPLGVSAEANRHIGPSSNAAHYLSGDTVVESEASSSTDANHVARKYLQGKESISDVEETFFLSRVQQSNLQELSEVVHNIHYIEMLFITSIKRDVHEALSKTLENASKKVKDYNKSSHSWKHTFLLSKQQRGALKKEVVYAGEVIEFLSKVCADVPGIWSQIEWLQKPRGQLKNKEEYEKLLELDERTIKASLFYTEKYITSHCEYLKVSHQKIKEYIAQTESFLAEPENLPPEPDIIDRASMFLTALPGLLGALITGMAYLFGAANIAAFIPLVIGVITTCISAVLYIINVLKFIPDEKVRQNTHQRRQLCTVVFPKILKLLEEAIKMNYGVVSDASPSYDSNYIAAVTLLRQEAKKNASKEDTATINEKLDQLLAARSTSVSPDSEAKDRRIAELEKQVTVLKTVLHINGIKNIDMNEIV